MIINKVRLNESPLRAATDDDFESEAEYRARMEAEPAEAASNSDTEADSLEDAKKKQAKQTPKAEIISDEESDTSYDWDEKWRDEMEEIGMKVYSPDNGDEEDETLFDVLDHFLYVNWEKKANITGWGTFHAENPDVDYDDSGVSSTMKEQPSNVLILGQPGTGKTGMIEEWMKQRHVVGVKFTGAQLTPTIVQGLPFKTHRADDPNVEVQGYLPTTAFDALETEGNLPAVLFIDEINRSLPEAEAAILTLVNSHEIPDGTRAGGVRKFNNFLFTIAAANPPAGASEEELELGSIRKLSLALKTRFATFFQESSVHETADYLRRKLFRDSKGREAAIKAGISSQKLGNAIISANQRKAMILDVLEQAEADGRIHYTTPEAGRAAAKKEDSVFNARTLEATLEQCNGYIGDEKGSSIHGRQFSNRSFLAFYVKNCSEDQLDEIIEVLEPLKDTFVADLDNEANAFTKTWYDKFNQWMKKNQDMIN